MKVLGSKGLQGMQQNASETATGIRDRNGEVECVIVLIASLGQYDVQHPFGDSFFFMVGHHELPRTNKYNLTIKK